MSVSKTTMLFNSKFPSNDIRLDLNFFHSQIISLWMKNIGNLKGLYLKWRLFSLGFFYKVLLGLASLYHIQMKSPKTIYLTEQCQLKSHRNSVHSVWRGTKMSKHHVLGTEIWLYTLLCICSWNMSLQYFYPSIDWMQYKCINVSFFVQNACLKVDLDPLFISVNVISLLFDRISWICCKLCINDCS